jgi:hypothetical protein
VWNVGVINASHSFQILQQVSPDYHLHRQIHIDLRYRELNSLILGFHSHRLFDLGEKSVYSSYTRINRVSKNISTLFIACLGLCSALTDASGMPPLAAINSIVVHTQLATPVANQGSSRTLLAKAFETGTIRTIVGLDLGMAPVDRLKHSQAGRPGSTCPLLDKSLSIGTKPECGVRAGMDFVVPTLACCCELAS